MIEAWSAVDPIFLIGREVHHYPARIGHKPGNNKQLRIGLEAVTFKPEIKDISEITLAAE